MSLSMLVERPGVEEESTETFPSSKATRKFKQLVAARVIDTTKWFWL